LGHYFQFAQFLEEFFCFKDLQERIQIEEAIQFSPPHLWP
jgi:hypothetical protein